MADEEPSAPHPPDVSDPEPDVSATRLRSDQLRSEESLARSKDEVTPRFKEPKGPKKPSRWAPGRKVGGR